MKILHTGDIHLGELTGPIINGENARMQNTIRCMNHLEAKAMEEDVDIILIAGDLFNKSKLWADEMLKEITIASTWLRRLSNIAPTVLMFGTANHDNVKAFENIKRMGIEDLTVVTEPDLFQIHTKNGTIQIAAVPGVDKGYFRTLFPGMDMEDENKAISEALGNVILGISAEAEKHFPLVLMSHYTVTGCTLENGEQIFLNSDIVIPTSALAASNYDLVCLGHIHKAQSVPNCGRPVYYSGPVNGITFNEEGQDKGFWIHCLDRDFGNGCVHVPRFIKTPSREFWTLGWNDNDIQDFISSGILEEAYVTPVKDKIVRIIYSCSDELNKQFSKKSLEKALYDAGAFYVHEIRPSKILATVDKNAMSENDSVEGNLKLWLEKQEIYPEDITKVLEVAKPMIVQASASLPTGKLTGVFEPLRLEVKNYRSYLEEEFDFTKVSFATVNGPNGIGKSSFFMDAIADCLYEQPREGELTGWISNGNDIKSGAITFEFFMGAEKWRVIRTRAKSGKTTLALQKYIDTEWKDFSGDKKDQTQDKILNLLGMDALTFKSCALIMQDNYGVFLEAEKTERMQVLGNILGLGIYDKLHDLAKEELRIQNRKAEAIKSEIASLDEKLKSKGFYEQQLDDSLEEKIILQEALQRHGENLKELNDKFEKVKENKLQIQSLTEKILSITDDIKARESEKTKLVIEQERVQNIVNQEEKILAKIKEYEQTKECIATLKAKQPLLRQKTNELISITAEIKKCRIDIKDLSELIIKVEAQLKDKSTLEAAVMEINKLEYQLEEAEKAALGIQELKQRQTLLHQKSVLLSREYDSTLEKLKAELLTYKRKADLIDDSKCPVDNPTCNFLKDALEARSKIHDIENQMNNLDKTAAYEANRAFNHISEEIENFKYDSVIHQDLKNKVNDIRKKKEKLLSLSGQDLLLESYKKQQNESLLQLEKFMLRKQDLEQELKLLQEENLELVKLESMLPALERWYRGKDELPAAKQSLKSINERITIINSEISNKNMEVIHLETARDKICDEIAEHSSLENDIKMLSDEISNFNNELTNIHVSIGITTSKIEELNKTEFDRGLKSMELREYAECANRLSLLVKAFCIDGIPFQIVRNVVSELSAQSNEILSQMTGGKMAIEMKTEKVLKNKNEVNALEIWISDYQRGTMPYLSRSGGQKVKAALSVAFALADLKANRAGIQLGMMFIDEPPFLDKEGVQAYCDALELMHTRYPNMRVVAISHDPAMKARFPQEIEVIDAGDKGSKILLS